MSTYCQYRRGVIIGRSPDSSRQQGETLPSSVGKASDEDYPLSSVQACKGGAHRAAWVRIAIFKRHPYQNHNNKHALSPRLFNPSISCSVEYPDTSDIALDWSRLASTRGGSVKVKYQGKKQRTS